MCKKFRPFIYHFCLFIKIMLNKKRKFFYLRLFFSFTYYFASFLSSIFTLLLVYYVLFFQTWVRNTITVLLNSSCNDCNFFLRPFGHEISVSVANITLHTVTRAHVYSYSQSICGVFNVHFAVVLIVVTRDLFQTISHVYYGHRFAHQSFCFLSHTICLLPSLSASSLSWDVIKTIVSMTIGRLIIV